MERGLASSGPTAQDSSGSGSPRPGGAREGALVAAAERVLRRYAHRYHPRLEADLDAIVRGLVPTSPGDPTGPSALAPSEALALLHALRTEVLRAWPPEDGSLLALMQATETLQTAILGEHRNPSLEQALTPFSRSILREVAHMLRSPLGSIVIMSDALRENGQPLTAEKRNKQLAIIYRAALGVAELAGSLLSLVDGGDVEAASEFPARRVLEAVADVASPVAEVRESELSVQAANDLRAVAPEATVGRALLGIALRGVLRTRGGSVRLEATGGAEGRCTFAVVARGHDVAPETPLASLLNVFRVDGETASYTLSPEGLSLVATERMIRSMGSELGFAARNQDELRLWFSVRCRDARDA